MSTDTVTRSRVFQLNSIIIFLGRNVCVEPARGLSQKPDPNHPYCQYCEETTYHEYDPYYHAWICQTCFGGMIRSDKKDPFSIIRAELNSLALRIAKNGYTLDVKVKLREAAARLLKLAEG